MQPDLGQNSNNSNYNYITPANLTIIESDSNRKNFASQLIVKEFVNANNFNNDNTNNKGNTSYFGFNAVNNIGNKNLIANSIYTNESEMKANNNNNFYKGFANKNRKINNNNNSMICIQHLFK